MTTPRVHVGPHDDEEMAEAIRRGGGAPSDLADADAIVWSANSRDGFPEPLPSGIRWVQLPSAGIESWVELLDGDRTWTSAAGAYAETVAEHALALLLAGNRRLHTCARAADWVAPDPRVFIGSTVAIVGAGGIGRALIPMLAPLRASVVAVNRSGRAIEGAERTLPVEQVHQVWPAADAVVIAAPATAATRQLVGAEELAAMRPHAWLVNVARGSLIDTGALVRALDAEQIGGAALDVTDPEPLPAGHPLWGHPRALITPHSANPPYALRMRYLERVEENVARFAAGEQLVARIDVDAGY